MKQTPRTEMVTILANYYLDKFECNDWHFRINTRLKKSLGQCIWCDKEIQVGLECIERSSMCEIILVIIHEIAHIFCEEDEDNHSRIWDSQYQEIKLLY